MATKKGSTKEQDKHAIDSSYKAFIDSPAGVDLIKYLEKSADYLTSCATNKIGYDKEGNAYQLNNEQAMDFLQRAGALKELKTYVERRSSPTKVARNEPTATAQK